MSSPFRHTSDALNNVAKRAKEYKDSFSPDGTNYHKAKTRRNAYVTITASGKTGSGTLPTQKNTYDALYSNVEGKPDVLLTGVKITEGSDFGMLRTVEGEFLCLSRAAFDKWERIFLRPKQKLTVKYGYVDGSDSESAKDFVICKYAFELDDKNRYKCTFKAYGPGPFINQVECGAKGNYTGMKITTKGFRKADVTTLPQYLKFIAQGEGESANIDIPDWTNRDNKKVWVLDNPNAWTPDGMIQRKVYKILQAIGLFSSDASKKIYCTLEWFVDALQKYHIEPYLEDEMKGRKLIANNKFLKAGAHPHPEVGSAYPMSIVLPGTGTGYYGSDSKITDEECKMDFDSNCRKAVDGTKGDYRNILLSYEYLSSKVFGSSKERGTVASNDKADKDGKKNVPPKVTVNSILNIVFNDIYHATGGLVQLATQEGSNSKELLVIPKNADPVGIDVTRFDPINGDGITRKCTVKCDVPADDAYAVANGGAAGGSGHTSSLIAEDEAATEPAKDDVKEAKSTIKELMEIGLSASEFDNEDCDALAAAFKTLIDKSGAKKAKKQSHDKNIWPLNLEIELDGVSGFRFGDVVGTSFMPKVYNGTKVQFVVTEASNTISNNDWSTVLKTQCYLGSGA